MRLTAVWTGLSSESSTTRLTERLIDAAVASARADGADPIVTRINLRQLATGLVNMTVTPTPDPELEEAFEAVQQADAVITATPIYKMAPVGIHTLFWQLIDEGALTSTPVLLASTGGTPRHSLAAESTLRPMLGYLKGLVIPTSVFAATDDWGDPEDATRLARRIETAAAELMAWASGNTGGRVRAEKPVDALDPVGVTPFEQLLEQR